MAKTDCPLVWDFYRVVDGAEELGGVVHYYDEMSQSLWLSSNGMKTNVADIPEGHWRTATPEDTIDIGTPNYDLLSLNHPYNGVLFGAATLGNELVYLRYVYAMDCSDIVDSGSIEYSNSNSVVQVRANLMNIKEQIFMNESTVFQPGARVIFKVLAGSESSMDMCNAFLDSVDYNAKSSTVPISGRNNIGFKLMQSTFDEDMTITGKPNEVAQQICTLGGIKKLYIQSIDDSRSYEFRADQTLMAGLEQLCNFYPGWKIVELPNGTIVIGPPNFINSYQDAGYYVFERDSVFRRKTKRSCDASYTKVRITGKDADGNDLTPVICPVANYNQWGLPPNKTYHESMPDGYTQAELQTYAESVAEMLQYVGVGEEFSGSFQPQLCIGDVAAVSNDDNTMTALGLVTSIKHTFGRAGFTTDFSTDSGGVLMEMLDADTDLVTVTKPLNGYNRKQTMKDLIQVASGSSKAGPQTSGTVVRVVSSSNATTLEGKTYQEIINDSVIAASQEIESVPEYAETDYGKVLSPSAEGLVWKDDQAGTDSGVIVKEGTLPQWQEGVANYLLDSSLLVSDQSYIVIGLVYVQPPESIKSVNIVKMQNGDQLAYGFRIDASAAFATSDTAPACQVFWAKKSSN